MNSFEDELEYDVDDPRVYEPGGLFTFFSISEKGVHTPFLTIRCTLEEAKEKLQGYYDDEILPGSNDKPREGNLMFAQVYDA